eukprot:1211891-Rhodomonas_salina.4
MIPAFTVCPRNRTLASLQKPTPFALVSVVFPRSPARARHHERCSGARDEGLERMGADLREDGGKDDANADGAQQLPEPKPPRCQNPNHHIRISKFERNTLSEYRASHSARAGRSRHTFRRNSVEEPAQPGSHRVRSVVEAPLVITQRWVIRSTTVTLAADTCGGNASSWR